MIESSHIEISKSALENNFSFLKRHFGAGAVFSSVVKGNAYGHGIREFVPLAYSCGIRHFSVFSAEEAYRVRQACDAEYRTMIMGDVEDEALEWAIRNDIEFFVFDPQRLEQAVALAQKLRLKAKVHLEAETGMNRTGLSRKDLQWAARMLKDHPNQLEFTGLCTHFAGAESITNHVRVSQQIRRFRQVAKYFEQENLHPQYRHTACSAAAMNYPETRMQLVRIGILQYGFWPSPETFIQFIGKNKDKADPLQRAISWKSKILSTKSVSPGEFIGYGTSYLARDNMRIAVIPVGYAHGYNRSLSNQGRLLIRGQRVGVVGTVNMNMIIADVSDLAEARKGDEVTLIGAQGQMQISVASFSELSDQLNYELLTRLSGNIPRKIVF